MFQNVSALICQVMNFLYDIWAAVAKVVKQVVDYYLLLCQI